MVEIRALEPALKPAAMTTISQAFYDDPMSVLLAPAPGQRAGAIGHMFAPPVNLCLKHGIAECNADASAVALWMPPGQGDFSFVQMVQFGLLSLPFKVRPLTLLRMMRLLGKAEKAHHAAIPGPHWYLLTLAVHPEKQGQGLGTAMVEHGLKRIDADRQPVYLDTSNERNLKFYEQFGFQVVHAGEFTPGGTPFWGLLREGSR